MYIIKYLIESNRSPSLVQQMLLILFKNRINYELFRNKLKGSEYRGEQAEMNIQRLNVRIDQVPFNYTIICRFVVFYIFINTQAFF